MSLTGPVLKITAGAIAGLFSAGSGVAIHAHNSGGAGNSSGHLEASVSARTGNPDDAVQRTASLAEGGAGHSGGGAANASGDNGGARASAGASTQGSRPAGLSVPRVGPVGTSVNLAVPNVPLVGTAGGGSGSNGSNGSNSGGGGGVGGGGGQGGVGSVPALNAQGSHTVVVPATTKVDKELCLGVATTNRCQPITVNSVPGATLTLAYAGNASPQPPSYSTQPCTGGLLVGVTGLTPGASVTLKLNGRTVLSASVPSHGVPVRASLCDR